MLVVDEDRDVLRAVRISLLCAGYEVMAAESADDALELVRSEPSGPEVLIADLDLTGPDDGLTLIGKVRQALRYKVPLVLMVGALTHRHWQSACRRRI